MNYGFYKPFGKGFYKFPMYGKGFYKWPYWGI